MLPQMSALGHSRLRARSLASGQCPLGSESDRIIASPRNDARGHRRTLPTSFNYLVGAGDHRFREWETKHFCGPEVENQIDFCRLLDWHVRRPFALQNSASVDTDLTREVRSIGSIAH